MITQDYINNILWQACDTFRGKIDSSIYKDYILVMLFVKYLSDTYKEHYGEYHQRYDGDEERSRRALSRDRFVLREKSTFDYFIRQKNDVEMEIILIKPLERMKSVNKSKLRGVSDIDSTRSCAGKKPKERNAILKSFIG